MQRKHTPTPAKKGTPQKSKAKAATPAPPRVTTLSTVVELDPHITDNDIKRWRGDAELYARALESPDSPEALRDALGALLSDLFNLWRANESDPRLLRVLYPLMRADLEISNVTGTADGLCDAIFTVFDALCPEALAERIRAEVKAAEKGGSDA